MKLASFRDCPFFACKFQCLAMTIPNLTWVVVWNSVYFHPYLGKWSNLTSIFFRWVAQPPTSYTLMDREITFFCGRFLATADVKRDEVSSPLIISNMTTVWSNGWDWFTCFQILSQNPHARSVAEGFFRHHHDTTHPWSVCFFLEVGRLLQAPETGMYEDLGWIVPMSSHSAGRFYFSTRWFSILAILYLLRI